MTKELIDKLDRELEQINIEIRNKKAHLNYLIMKQKLMFRLYKLLNAE